MVTQEHIRSIVYLLDEGQSSSVVQLRIRLMREAIHPYEKGRFRQVDTNPPCVMLKVAETGKDLSRAM